WAAFDATYYTGGRTTIDGEKGERLENVRLGLTATLSVSRHQSMKLVGSAGVYNRTENNFWAVGLAWKFRWGGGLSQDRRGGHTMRATSQLRRLLKSGQPLFVPGC